MNHFPTSVLLAFTLAACTTEATEPTDVTDDPTSVGDPTIARPTFGPEIRALKWRWTGCGPSASPLGLSLTVDVVVDSTTDPYALKGQAVGCDPFDASGELRSCPGAPASPVRGLSVSVAGKIGPVETRSVPLSDCIDGSIAFPATE